MTSLTMDANLINLLTKKDMEENFNGSTFGEDGKSFIIISEFSEDPEIRELWKILPREFKEEAYRNEGKQLAVRKELFHNYFGYRIPSITNFPWLKDSKTSWMRRINPEKPSVSAEKMPACRNF